MVELLIQMLETNFGLLPNGKTRISQYPRQGFERVFVDLFEMIFFELEEPLIDIGDIRALAEQTFGGEVEYQFFENEEEWNGHVIDFDPDPRKKEKNSYRMAYQHHHIVVNTPLTSQRVSIYAGDGRMSLNSVQRTKYFSFVLGVYNLFVERAEAAQKKLK